MQLPHPCLHLCWHCCLVLRCRGEIFLAVTYALSIPEESYCSVPVSLLTLFSRIAGLFLLLFPTFVYQHAQRPTNAVVAF
jgi:hypothetical protein